MKAYFRNNGVRFEVETDLDHTALYVLWKAATHHRCLIQVLVMMGGKPTYLNIRTLDDATFEGMVVSRSSIPPPA